MAPKLLLLHAAVYLYQLADNVFISFLSEGSIGALGYGWTLMMVLPGLLSFGGAFITIFAEKRERGEDGADVLNNLITMALFLGVPVTLFLMMLLLYNFAGQQNHYIPLHRHKYLDFSEDCQTARQTHKALYLLKYHL